MPYWDCLSTLRNAAWRALVARVIGREFEVSAFLARHVGLVITHRMSWQRLDTHGVEDLYARASVNRLRRVLGDAPPHHRYIQTDPGVGDRVFLEKSSAT